MKYKVKHEKKNLALTSSVLFLCFVSCLFWFVLKEYTYFAIYIILTIVISYIYYFTTYQIGDKNLIIKLGFIKIKIDYKRIKSVKELTPGIELKFQRYHFKIYPNNQDMFYLNLISRMKGN